MVFEYNRFSNYYFFASPGAAGKLLQQFENFNCELLPLQENKGGRADYLPEKGRRDIRPWCSLGPVMLTDVHCEPNCIRTPGSSLRLECTWSTAVDKLSIIPHHPLWYCKGCWGTYVCSGEHWVANQLEAVPASESSNSDKLHGMMASWVPWRSFQSCPSDASWLLWRRAAVQMASWASGSHISASFQQTSGEPGLFGDPFLLTWAPFQSLSQHAKDLQYSRTAPF